MATKRKGKGNGASGGVKERCNKCNMAIVTENHRPKDDPYGCWSDSYCPTCQPRA